MYNPLIYLKKTIFKRSFVIEVHAISCIIIKCWEVEVEQKCQEKYVFTKKSRKHKYFKIILSLCCDRPLFKLTSKVPKWCDKSHQPPTHKPCRILSQPALVLTTSQLGSPAVTLQAQIEAKAAADWHQLPGSVLWRPLSVFPLFLGTVPIFSIFSFLTHNLFIHSLPPESPRLKLWKKNARMRLGKEVSLNLKSINWMEISNNFNSFYFYKKTIFMKILISDNLIQFWNSHQLY